MSLSLASNRKCSVRRASCLSSFAVYRFNEENFLSGELSLLYVLDAGVQVVFQNLVVSSTFGAPYSQVPL